MWLLPAAIRASALIVKSAADDTSRLLSAAAGASADGLIASGDKSAMLLAAASSATVPSCILTVNDSAVAKRGKPDSVINSSLLSSEVALRSSLTSSHDSESDPTGTCSLAGADASQLPLLDGLPASALAATVCASEVSADAVLMQLADSLVARTYSASAVLEAIRALTIKNSVTELLRLAGDVFSDQASLGQICDWGRCRASGLLCPVLWGSHFCWMHDMSSGDVCYGLEDCQPQLRSSDALTHPWGSANCPRTAVPRARAGSSPPADSGQRRAADAGPLKPDGAAAMCLNAAGASGRFMLMWARLSLVDRPGLDPAGATAWGGSLLWVADRLRLGPDRTDWARLSKLCLVDRPPNAAGCAAAVPAAPAPVLSTEGVAKEVDASRGRASLITPTLLFSCRTALQFTAGCGGLAPSDMDFDKPLVVDKDRVKVETEGMPRGAEGRESEPLEVMVRGREGCELTLAAQLPLFCSVSHLQLHRCPLQTDVISARMDSSILLVPMKEAGCSAIGRVAAERGF
ncbi:MAG: hypothetical protein FRX49_12456 [Trebouxia sp. A1-2]|nr:MAG: hypothetical protein FRX49_12456 [Trebouxia sp. A1-2]